VKPRLIGPPAILKKSRQTEPVGKLANDNYELAKRLKADGKDQEARALWLRHSHRHMLWPDG